MAMDLRGILNQNEYYTNHYFTTIFEENAADTISNWRQAARDNQTAAPWAAFRDTSKAYYRIREKYLQMKNEEGSRGLIENQAAEYLAALGYGRPDSIHIELNDEFTVPVFHEVKKPNGAPLLWVLLSVAEERNDDILMGRVFGRMDTETEEYGAVLSENNDDVLAKLFFAGAEAPRWIILIGINQIALLDRNKWDKKKYLQFDLEEIFSRHEETTFQALTVLLHKESLCPAEGNSLLDALDENSYKHSSSVSDSLKYALRECIELLGNEVLYDRRTRKQADFAEHPVDAGELTIQCLRYMYRILFILFIEAREELGFAPMKSDVYQKGYSLEGVRDVCENVREVSAEAAEGYYIHETISALFDMVYNGYPREPEAYREALKLTSPHHMFTMEPLKAHIFDPQYTTLINEAKLRNVTMLKIIDLMSISRPSNNRGRRGRISYSALGINQMGAVYEALLSYRGFIAGEDLYEVKRAGDKFNELDVGYFVPERELDKYAEEERVRYEDDERKGKLRMYEKGTFIYRLAGREREKSASYYTPEVLTKCLVKYALKELLKEKRADEILNMTVCEPAMGSAAFLNEAISQLAEAYLDKKQEELGEQIAFDKRAAELQRVKMFIADRNVYGVDLNPIAVELAEVSLWLNTIYKGAHVPWFGTQLACGNSLIGARRQVYNALKLKKGTWYNEEPEKVPEEWVTDRHETRKVYKRKRSGGSYIYHFLLGDPGMANYTDKVIRELEPENSKLIKQKVKEFCVKYTEDDIEILNKFSDIVDDLWMRTIHARQRVEIRTEDALSVYGHDEGAYEEHLTIRQKDAIYKKIYKSEGGDNASPYARLKAAMDYWCALWFWPIEKAELFPTRQEFFMELSLILEGGISPVVKKNIMPGQMEMQYDTKGEFVGFGIQGSEIVNEILSQTGGLGAVNLEQARRIFPRLQIVEDIARQQRFMHWELEFADLFYERGGFDLVIGNPPWIKVTWNEQDILSEYQPEFMIKKFSAKETAAERNKQFENGNCRHGYLNEYESISGIQAFMNANQNYYVLQGLQSNLYECFLPLAINNVCEDGVFAFIHPETVFNDLNAYLIREKLYPRLRKHFRFSNALKLFAGVHSSREFGLNVFSNAVTNRFENIFNLYVPNTIDESYEDAYPEALLAMRNDDGDRELRGNKSRIISIGEPELKLLANVVDDSKKWECARLLVMQLSQYMDILKILNAQSNTIGMLGDKVYASMMWDETNAQKNGIIKRNTHYSENLYDCIYSGNHIGIANPLFNTPRESCKGNNDTDSIDLTNISEGYMPRSNYEMVGSVSDYMSKLPETGWGDKYTKHYRIACRKMIDCEGARTLMSAIIPPKIGHTNGIIGFAFQKYDDLLISTGLFLSLPVDFFVKLFGKSNFYINIANMIPFITDRKFYGMIKHRVLMLNCVNTHYSSLWAETYESSFNGDKWLKDDRRLTNKFFETESKWSSNSFLKSDYDRRQALLELDVIIARALGVSLEQLKLMYQVQFSTLRNHEAGTWYDRKGRIVFTNNRSLTNVGFSRKEWEDIKDAPKGIFTRTITDDTLPGGPIERTIEYIAPFDRCDREKDYEEIWANFEKRFADQEGGAL